MKSVGIGTVWRGGLIAAFLAAGSAAVEAANDAVLRAGYTPTYPPVVFVQNGQPAGIEIDLARQLAADLGMPLRLIEMEWDKLIPALVAGDIDIIMAGMTITDARRVRMDFSRPYLRTGQLVLMRRSRAHLYPTADAVRATKEAVGVIKNTTGDGYVQAWFTNAQRRAYNTSEDAALELSRKRLDLFVDDAPSIWWQASQHEADLTVLATPLTEEYLAWGIARTNPTLLAAVNKTLRRWEKDGTLRRILQAWIPMDRAQPAATATPPTRSTHDD